MQQHRNKPHRQHKYTEKQVETGATASSGTEIPGRQGHGEWNPETYTWANGKTHKPLPQNLGPEWHDEVDSWETGSETDYSMLRLNVDLRLGIAYNWSNYFIGLQAQFNNFSYKKDECKVNLFDAYARLSFGVRL
ncbi:MAG: hypothetical protein IKH01_08460 [Prevotella sp.]|nr:hypothetical protein [Prevotella sp.]